MPLIGDFIAGHHAITTRGQPAARADASFLVEQ